MLHDVGKLIFACHLGSAWQGVLRAGGGTTRPLHLVEREQLGATHADVGAYLLGLWGLPYPIVEAIARHHEPLIVYDDDNSAVIAATHIASVLANHLSHGGGPDEAIDPTCLRVLGMDDDFDSLIARAESIAADSPRFN